MELRLESLEPRWTPAYTQTPHAISDIPAGTALGNGQSFHDQGVTVSADGRYEVFSSDASNLSSDVVDANGLRDIFLRDLWTGTTRTVSKNSTGTATSNGNSYDAVISANGRYVAFSSNGNNLQGLPNPFFSLQVYRWDRQTDTTILISVNSTGGAGSNFGSYFPSISDDGDRIAFVADATDLTALPDGNFQIDTFARIVSTASTVPVSINSAGTATPDAGTIYGQRPQISGDGATVTFTTLGSNLVAGVLDNNGQSDVYQRNLNAHTTTLISVGTNAPGTTVGAVDKSSRSLSADGRYQVYLSSAGSNVALRDANNLPDVFVRDLVLGTTLPVSINSAGTAMSGALPAIAPIISANGRYVVFMSEANDLVVTPNSFFRQLYRRDLLTNTTVMATVNLAGTAGSVSFYFNVSLSDDGNRLAFESQANDLVSGISDPLGNYDIFVRDFSANTTIQASVTHSGTASPNANCLIPEISGDGTKVVFSSAATDLVAGALANQYFEALYVRNLTTSTTSTVSVQSTSAGTSNYGFTNAYRTGAPNRAVSSDGRYQVFATKAHDLVGTIPDRNIVSDIYLRDVVAGTTTLVSVNSLGTAASFDYGSTNPSISANGRYVFFLSASGELTAEGSNNYNQLFRRDRSTGTTVLVSKNSAGSYSNSLNLTEYSVSDDGNFAAFACNATDLVAGLTDTNFDSDVFVRNISAGTTVCASVTPGGLTTGNAGVSDIALSANGAAVVFDSMATDLTALADTNAAVDIFLRNLTTSITSLASVNSGGTAAGDAGAVGSRNSISDDGTRLAFYSASSDLVAGAPGGGQIFVRDVATSTTFGASRSTLGVYGSLTVHDNPIISGNGRYVAFASTSSNLHPLDGNLVADVFRRDLLTNTTDLVSIDSTGAAASGGSLYEIARISADGNVIAFLSINSDFVSGFNDFNFLEDVYVRNMSAGTTVCANRSTTATQVSNGRSRAPEISADGSRVFFLAEGSDLVGGTVDFNGDFSDAFYFPEHLDAYSYHIAGNANVLLNPKATGTFIARGERASISFNGDRIAFNSIDGTLVDNDRSYHYSVFARNVAAGTTVLVDVNAAGTQAGENSSSLEYGTAITPDGRYVVFASSSNDLVTAQTTYGNGLYRRDLLTNTTVLINVDAAGTGSGGSNVDDLSISADGNLITYYTNNAASLIAGLIDGGSTANIVYRNVSAGTTHLVSSSTAANTTSNGNSFIPIISANGSRITFLTVGTNLVAGITDFSPNDADIYAATVPGNSKQAVTVRAAATFSGDYPSDSPSVSANGQRVAFHSQAPNLVTNDTNALTDDVFLRDLSAATTTLISVSTSGGAGDYASYAPTLTPDGRFVAFVSSAQNMTPISTIYRQVYRRDTTANATVLVSIASSGTAAGDYESDQPGISADGNLVAFRSTAANLVVSDGNSYMADIFVRDIAAAATALVSKNGALAANGASEVPTIARDGSFVAFRSLADNLVAGATDANFTYDLFAAFRDPVTVLDVVDVSPDPRATAVSDIDVVLSRVVNLATFTAADFNLNRNFGPNLLSGFETVSYLGGTTYRLGGLAALTGVDGNYELTVNMAGVADPVGNAGDGAAIDAWVKAPSDTTAPTVTGLFIDGTAWSGAFRTAAGDATYGYPAQTGAGQLTPLPWNTINTLYVHFSEPVAAVTVLQVGVRGINVANYTVSGVAMTTPSIAKITLSGAFDTDRILLDLAGAGGLGVVDLAGNQLAGAWSEGVSTFPTAGAAGVDFEYRFVVTVGDASRNGQVRNADLNQVRNQLFIDVGQVGYSIYADIDGNGLTRNADLNATRNHLFVDPPAGPGPFRGGVGGGDRNGNRSAPPARTAWRTPTSTESASEARPRWRVARNLEAVAAELDEIFADF